MQALADSAPLVAFLVAYHYRGIYAATAVLMAAMVALVLADWLRVRRVSPMHALSTVLVLALGSATLLLHDTRFIRWKPTVFLWLVALVTGASRWVGSKPLPQRSLEPVVPGAESLPRSVWNGLTWLWVGFCALLGALNLVIAYHTSERTWVHFKVIGMTVAMFVFLVGQSLWLSKRVESTAVRP